MNLLYKDLKLFISNKILLGIWIVLMIVLCWMFSRDVKQAKVGKLVADIGICNYDEDNKYSTMLVDVITNAEDMRSLIKIHYADEKELEKQFMDHKLDCYIVVPKGFMDHLINIDFVPIKVRLSDENSITAIIVKNVLDSFSSYISSIQNNVTALNRAQSALGLKYEFTSVVDAQMSIKLATQVLEKDTYFDYVKYEDNTIVTMKQYMLFSFLVIIITFGALFSGVDLLKEKSYGVVERYKSQGGNMITFIGMKAFMYTVIMYSLILIPNVIASYIKDFKLNKNLMLLYLWLILFCVSISVLMAVIAGRIRTYVLMANMVCITSILVGGGIIPVVYLSDKLAKLAEFTPTFHFITVLSRVNSNITPIKYKNVIILFTALSLLMLFISSLLAGRREKI